MDAGAKAFKACSGSLLQSGLLVLGIGDDEVVANGVDQPSLAAEERSPCCLREALILSWLTGMHAATDSARASWFLSGPFLFG